MSDLAARRKASVLETHVFIEDYFATVCFLSLSSFTCFKFFDF